MGQEPGEEGGAPTGAPMTVRTRPVVPTNNTPASDEPPASLSHASASSLRTYSRHRVTIMAAMAGCVLFATLLLLFTDAGRTTAGVGKARATPTARPSPTATAISSPTAMLGFKVYTDVPDGFIIQYPSTWQLSSPSPTIEFDDSKNDSSYAVQVIIPNDATPPGSGGDPGAASAWVQYAIDQLATVAGTVQQETGPIPSKVIGGEVWQSGIARISQGQTVIRVQVYATVHNGKPYIINLLAVDDRFIAGSEEFFDPMLSSFQFLSPNQ